jgi:ribose-phosphate pyrophosphokinase
MMAQTHTAHNRMMYGDVKLYAGTACPDLASRIASYLGTELCDRDIIQFPNDNLFVKLRSSVRGQDCYVIQTTSNRCTAT